MQFAAVLEPNPDVLIAANDMMVRQQKTVRCEEDSGAGPFASPARTAQVHHRGPEFFRHVHHHAGKSVQGFGFAPWRVGWLRRRAAFRTIGDEMLPEF